MTPSNHEIAQEFLRGRNCAQCVLGQYASALGFGLEETDRMAQCFGGGMELGETCGAVTGAMMVIGLACEDKEEARQLSAQFARRFQAQFGSTMCRELLQYDLSQPEQAVQARASGRLIDFCPGLVVGAMEILDDILEI